MDNLRKHIKESFFNPILHFLPLLVFLVVDDFFGMVLAWEISFPFALMLLIYIYLVFNRIFTWHLIFTAIFICSGIMSALSTLFPFAIVNQKITYEFIVLTFLIFFIVFRKQIQKWVVLLMSNLIPMSNNFEELYYVIRTFAFVLFLYISGFFIIKSVGKNVELYQDAIQYVYLAVLFFLAIYEILRVQIVRSKLIGEEWLPIVNNQGKIIGSIQHQTSLHDEKKYQHPVVRILLVDRGMILLNKLSGKGNNSSELWDSTVSNHIVMEETIEQCVERTAKEKLAFDNFKYMFLSNYTLDCSAEIQYAFLFVSCVQLEYRLSQEISEQTKWWTQNQITENLNSGIFTENFKIEYDLLKRSGLLETGRCDCNCHLKDVIYQQSSADRTYN
jgi:isopentenyldiphosphate isomerase